jgi:hypothetical protein
MSLHSVQTKIHVMENWVFANATARVANGTFAAVDVGKVAYQSDEGSYWRLLTVTNPGAAATPTWGAIGGVTWDVRRAINLTAVVGLTGGGSTKLDGQPSAKITFGQLVIVTLSDSTAMYQYQNGAPNTILGDVALADNAGVRWRKTLGL